MLDKCLSVNYELKTKIKAKFSVLNDIRKMSILKIVCNDIVKVVTI